MENNKEYFERLVRCHKDTIYNRVLYVLEG